MRIDLDRLDGGIERMAVILCTHVPQDTTRACDRCRARTAGEYVNIARRKASAR